MNGWLRAHVSEHALKVVYDDELKRYIAVIAGVGVPQIIGVGISIDEAIASLNRELIAYEREQEGEPHADASKESVER